MNKLKAFAVAGAILVADGVVAASLSDPAAAAARSAAATSPGVSQYVTPGSLLARASLGTTVGRLLSVPLQESFAAPLSAGTSPTALPADSGSMLYASWKLYPRWTRPARFFPTNVKGARRSDQ